MSSTGELLIIIDFYIRAIIGFGLIFASILVLHKKKKNPEKYQEYNRSSLILFFFGASFISFILLDYIKTLI